MTMPFSISVAAAARRLPIASHVADLFIEELGEAVRSMVRVASHDARNVDEIWHRRANVHSSTTNFMTSVYFE